MADRTNVFAYTAPGPDMPEYISINIVAGGNVEIIIRSPKKNDGSYGDQGWVVLPRDQFCELILQGAKLTRQFGMI